MFQSDSEYGENNRAKYQTFMYFQTVLQTPISLLNNRDINTRDPLRIVF